MITKLTNFILEGKDSKTAIITLFNMFKSINDDCRESGESVVPFSNIEYYTSQIENIYGMKTHQAERIAQKLAKHAEESNITEGIITGGEYAGEYATLIDTDGSENKEVLVKIKDINNNKPIWISKHYFSDVNEQYDMDFENGDISEEYAKAIIDEAINSHKLSGIFNIKVLFDKFCTENDLPKFESRRAMVYNSLVDILSTMLHDVESMNEGISEAKSYSRPRGWAILPAGKLNLTNGDTDYFNVIDNLDGRDGTLVLVKKTGTETYMVISSSHKETDIKAGEYQEGYHDQNPNRKFHLKIQDSFPTTLDSLKKIKDIVGKKSVSFGVFK